MKCRSSKGKMNLELLKEILRKRDPNLVNLFESDAYKTIDADLGNHIRNLLTEEFCEIGLRANDEPNELGLEIEQLIDDVGNLFM